MLDSKYSKFLSVLLIIVIVSIVGLLGYLGFGLFKKVITKNDAEKFAEQYEEGISKENEEDLEAKNPLDGIESVDSNGKKKYMYKGFEVSRNYRNSKNKNKISYTFKSIKKGIRNISMYSIWERTKCTRKYSNCRT